MLPNGLSKEAQRMVESLHLSTTTYQQELALSSATSGGGGGGADNTSSGSSSGDLNAFMNARSWAPGVTASGAVRSTTQLSDLFSSP
jgi:hypothetical protein